MRKFVLFAVWILGAFALSAQPTPRPGMEPAGAPTLLPKEGNRMTNNLNNRNSVLPLQAGAAQSVTQVPATVPGAETPAAVKPQTPAATADVRPAEPKGIQWMSIEEAIEKSKTEKRKILIDVYTDWCGWCKRMDQTTFSDPKIAEYVNANYYAVKFNAEQKNDVVFKGKTYQFKRNGSSGYHELAAEWLNNRLGYPTVVFLDENLNTIQPLAGYQDVATFDAVIHYFATDSHKSTPWETYERKYKEGRVSEKK